MAATNGRTRQANISLIDILKLAPDYDAFDSEYPHTVSAIRTRTDVTAKQKDKILGKNAAKLLNL